MLFSSYLNASQVLAVGLLSSTPLLSEETLCRGDAGLRPTAGLRFLTGSFHGFWFPPTLAIGLFFFFLLKTVTSSNYVPEHGASASYLSRLPVTLSFQAQDGKVQKGHSCSSGQLALVTLSCATSQRLTPTLC